MISATDVANFFIDLFKDSDDPMTNLRLNKFLYFAQGWSLAKFGKPLFDEEIEAWDYGPTVKGVYNKFRSHGKDPIKNAYGEYDSHKFSIEQVLLLLDVAREYRQYSTHNLVEITHTAGGPWHKVYVEGEKGVKIPNETISHHFSNMVLKGFDMERAIKNLPSVGYIDSEGYTVLPKEFDD